MLLNSPRDNFSDILSDGFRRLTHFCVCGEGLIHSFIRAFFERLSKNAFSYIKIDNFLADVFWQWLWCSMKKKNLLRIILCSVAVVAALVVLGFSTGVFSFWKNGYDDFFDGENYRKAQIVLSEDYFIDASAKDFSLNAVSVFGENEKISAKVGVTVVKTDAGYEITFTFNHDYGFSGGVLYSATNLKKRGETYLAHDDETLGTACLSADSSGVIGSGGSARKEATVKLYANNILVSECTLVKCEFSRRKSVAIYVTDYRETFDKICISDVTATQFQLR